MLLRHNKKIYRIKMLMSKEEQVRGRLENWTLERLKCPMHFYHIAETRINHKRFRRQLQLTRYLSSSMLGVGQGPKHRRAVGAISKRALDLISYWITP